MAAAEAAAASSSAPTPVVDPPTKYYATLDRLCVVRRDSKSTTDVEYTDVLYDFWKAVDAAIVNFFATMIKLQLLPQKTEGAGFFVLEPPPDERLPPRIAWIDFSSWKELVKDDEMRTRMAGVCLNCMNKDMFVLVVQTRHWAHVYYAVYLTTHEQMFPVDAGNIPYDGAMAEGPDREDRTNGGEEAPAADDAEADDM